MVPAAATWSTMVTHPHPFTHDILQNQNRQGNHRQLLMKGHIFKDFLPSLTASSPQKGPPLKNTFRGSQEGTCKATCECNLHRHSPKRSISQLTPQSHLKRQTTTIQKKHFSGTSDSFQGFWRGTLKLTLFSEEMFCQGSHSCSE